MKMRAIVAEIARRGKMSGAEVSQYSRKTLSLKKMAAGGCISQAFRHGLIKITGTTFVNGKKYNIYELN